MRRLCCQVIALILGLASPALSDAVRDAGSLAPHVAKDASAPVVTEASLLESEKFWPYRATLAKRDLASGLAPGSTGVLIRVEEGARARIDFGRDGVHVLPVSITSLVAEANQVRRGELEKIAPNLALAIGPRLNGSALGMARLPFERAARQAGFLAVFADPRSEDLEAIAKALAPFQDHAGVMTVLFPQSLVDERSFGARLQALGWRIPYVYDFLVPGYTEALLAAPLRPPAVSLHTAEGRLLLAQAFGPGSADAVRAQLERSFPAP